MKIKLSRGLGIVAACAACFLCSCGDDDSAQEVRDAFDTYMTVMANKNADGMLAVIDPENIKHDDYVVEMARSGTKVQLIRLTAYDRLRMTILRGTKKAAELRDLDGRKLFKLTCENRWDRMSQSDGELTLGQVKITKPRASGALLYDGEPTGIQLELVEVDHHWLINKDSFDRVADRRITTLAAIAHTTDDDVIIRIASNSVGKELHKAMWEEPPK